MNSFIKKIRVVLQSASGRFPESFVAILIIGTLSLFFSHNIFIGYEDLIIRIIITGILYFFLSIGTTLYKESKIEKIVHHKKSLLNNTVVLFLAPIFFSIIFFVSSGIHTDDIWLVTFFIFTLLGVVAFLFFAPYINRSGDSGVSNSVYYGYFYTLSTAFFTASTIGFLTFIFSVIAITAIDTLFDLNYLLTDNLYTDTAILAFMFLSPIYGLSQIPKREEYNTEIQGQNVFFTLLIKYIALPFIILYFIILYAYTLQVLLNFSSWPRGEVSWLVTGFSLFGYLIYIFSFAYQDENTLIKFFRKVFPFIIVPQVGMLFYALYLRIAQYDITTNRYFLLIFGVFLLIISLYFCFSKGKKLVVVPSLLCLCTIVFSLGPWSIYNLPQSRQFARLQDNLIQANILVNDSIIPLSDYSDIDAYLSNEIYSGIEYLCNTHDCVMIQELFPDQYTNVVNNAMSTEVIDTFEPYPYQIVMGIAEQVRVQRQKSYGSYNEKYINRFVNLNDGFYPIALENYDSLALIKTNFDPFFEKNLFGAINIFDETLVIQEGENIIDTVNISKILKQMKTLESDFKEQASPEDMTYNLESEKYFIRLLIENFSLLKEKTDKQTDDKLRRENINGYMLLKLK